MLGGIIVLLLIDLFVPHRSALDGAIFLFSLAVVWLGVSLAQ